MIDFPVAVRHRYDTGTHVRKSRTGPRKARTGISVYSVSVYLTSIYRFSELRSLRTPVNNIEYFTTKLRGARSRLYRRRFLQANTRWKALAEIYTMHSFVPFYRSLISNFSSKIAEIFLRLN